ncbi:hypothetical protein, partial [Roseiconus lacunae]
ASEDFAFVPMRNYFQTFLFAALAALVAVPVSAGDRFLRVAYFCPSDRTPEDGHVARLDRVMTTIQTFYRNGMRKNGLGPITFDLERDARKQLRIVMVKG